MAGLSVERMRRRAEFLATAKGRRVAMRTLVLQMRQRDLENSTDARIGFTVSRKVGNAVERNRVRRRLREAARHSLPSNAKPGHDYVIVGRRAALTSPYERILSDLLGAFTKIHMTHPTAETISTDG